MATKEQQARWRAKHREAHNTYMRNYMRERYRRLHPEAKPYIARGDFKALGGMTKAEKSVSERDLTPPEDRPESGSNRYINPGHPVLQR